MKNMIFFLLYLLFNLRLFGLIFQNVYIPVFVQFEWLKNIPIKSVIDVGAYQGKVSRVLNYLFPKAKIYAFEPSDEIFKLKIKTYKNIFIENSAISDKSGNALLYQTDFKPASSLLQLGKNYRSKFKLLNQSKVKLKTLDEFFKDKKLKKHILLKIDTQGSELSVLKGADELLDKVSLIHIESPFKELYKNQSFFEDIYNFLTKKNFRFIGDIKDSQFYPDFNPPDAANCIYINKKLISQIK